MRRNKLSKIGNLNLPEISRDDLEMNGNCRYGRCEYEPECPYYNLIVIKRGETCKFVPYFDSLSSDRRREVMEGLWAKARRKEK